MAKKTKKTKELFMMFSKLPIEEFSLSKDDVLLSRDDESFSCSKGKVEFHSNYITLSNYVGNINYSDKSVYLEWWEETLTELNKLNRKVLLKLAKEYIQECIVKEEFKLSPKEQKKSEKYEPSSTAQLILLNQNKVATAEQVPMVVPETIVPEDTDDDKEVEPKDIAEMINTPSAPSTVALDTTPVVEGSGEDEEWDEN